MTTTTTPARVTMTMGHTAKDIGVITVRNMRRNIRLPQLLLFATVQPVMFLLLFNYVFGGSIGGTLPPAAGGHYINWLIPGLLIQVATFGAAQTSIGLTDDLKAGIIERFRSLPMARSAVLAGRTIADLARNTFVIGLMLAVGFFIGFRYQTSFFGLLGGFALALLFGYSFSWVMATIGLAVKDPETAQSAGFIPLFPLVFASSVFVPVETMPSWLRSFADNQPVTVLTNAVRGLILGEGALNDLSLSSQVVASLLWIGGILAVFAPLAVRMYRRAVG
ncbi:MAG: ABC transporter permease [Acidimicrobiia bacterium]